VAEITREHRELALDELEKVARTLQDMSMWIDDDHDDARQRAAILLEDTSKSAMSAGWLLERADRIQAGLMAHRRMSGNGAPEAG
jgi:hypothetical protein